MATGLPYEAIGQGLFNCTNVIKKININRLVQFQNLLIGV